MQVSIFFRKAIQSLIDGDFFCEHSGYQLPQPGGYECGGLRPGRLPGSPARLMYVCAPELDVDALPRFGLSSDTFVPGASALAAFNRQAVAGGLDIICRCD